jgi:hypothetical protein
MRSKSCTDASRSLCAQRRSSSSLGSNGFVNTSTSSRRFSAERLRWCSGDIPEHWPKRASRGWQLAVSVEDRFDVVPVRVNDERCVIPGVVMRAKARRAVVAAAGFDGGAVERVNGGSVCCGEGHMNGRGRGFAFPDPEVSTALDGKTQAPASSPPPSLRTARGPARRRCGCVSRRVLARPSGR